MLLAIVLAASLPAFIASVILMEGRERDVNDALRLSCNRNNIFRAVARLNDDDLPRTTIELPRAATNRLLVLLDCEETFKEGQNGRTVPLSATQEQVYLRIVKRGQIPIVSGGVVVGERAPEEAFSEDF